MPTTAPPARSSSPDRLIPIESDVIQDKSLPPTPAPGAAPIARSNPQATNELPVNHKKSNQEEKQEIMERMQPPKSSKPTDMAKQKGDRWETDPVTGQEVLVKDSQFEDYRGQGLDSAALDPANSKPGTSLRPPSDPETLHSKFPAPSPAKPSNILLQPFPPPASPSLKQSRQILRTGALIVTGLCAILWFFTCFGKSVSWKGFFFKSALFFAVVGASWIGAENAIRKLEKEVERVRALMHQQRGEAWSAQGKMYFAGADTGELRATDPGRSGESGEGVPTPESVEWVNALFKIVWGLINPDMFVPIVDMVEDILQQSLPSFVDAVRIADVGQGSNPLRIVSMRALPDQPGTKGYPREEWVGLDKDAESKKQLVESDKQQAEKENADSESSQADMEQSGDYLNYEVSVSYQALPGQTSSNALRTSNMHLTLEFFIGAWDWFKIPVPIYAIVEGFVATARLRVQFVQSPPFVRNLTVTLMGVPKVEVSVEPFTKKLPNILDLPMIKRFVEMGIAAACAQFVAPKSMTLNLAQLLAGSNVPKDTKALGVLVINIHHAIGLSAQDRGGKSDPYIVLAYAKFGKPLYSTRIITGDINPVWEETAFLLVTEDEVKGEEEVSAMLWDSDKRTADDLVGRVNIPVTDLMRAKNKMIPRVDKLKGFQDANDMSGTLHWEIGYYEKIPLNKALKKDSKPTVPADVKDQISDQATIADTQEEKDALSTPPDPSIPTGILSVMIHQINNLERQDIKGNTGDREGQAGQDTEEPAQEGQHLPNSYCEIIVNDDMIYKTRVKQYSSMPYFEAGTERFIRDWKQTVVRVQVRDARVREKDPVLGIVTVKLGELFKNSSEVTRLFSLQEGVGYGRANISFMFRQVKTDLPRSMLGWETGTLEIPSVIRIEPAPDFNEGFNTKKLEICTTDDSYKVPSSSARLEGGSVFWDPPVEKVRLPVYNRFSSAVIFEIGSGGFGPIGQDSDFLAACWLRDIPDDEETEVHVPILKSKNLKQLRQNYINGQTAQNHEYEIVGYLNCTLILDSGLDPDHEEYQETQAQRHRYEAYDRVEGQARVAERTAQLEADGEISKKEKKEIEAEKKHQLQMRHRGVMQYNAARTGVWSKEGLKKRVGTLKDKITGAQHNERNQVESEA